MVEAAYGGVTQRFAQSELYESCQRLELLRPLQVAHLNRGFLALCATVRMSPTSGSDLELIECPSAPIRDDTL